ncbi:MAG: hypothetical protein WEC37_02000 [Anaerolineales bacterium]
MYQNTFNYVQSRVQELRYDSNPNPHYRELAASGALGEQVRQGAGEVLIALGTWIKPRKAASEHPAVNLRPVQMGGR